MGKTGVLAPDDGIISARSATVGSLTQPGQELFRLIRGGRLEWRAEVSSADLASLKPGMAATLVAPSGRLFPAAFAGGAERRSGDPERAGLCRCGVVAGNQGRHVRARCVRARAGAALDGAAVGAGVAREGFAYVFRIEGEDHVAQTRSFPAAASATGSRSSTD